MLHSRLRGEVRLTMWNLSKDLGLFARLAQRLDPRVTAFNARYELSRGLRGLVASPRSPATPTALYVETSSYCRGRCRGCYVPARDRNAHIRLPDDVLDDVVLTARRLRLDWVGVVGGEPLDEAIVDVNVAMIRRAPDLRFMLCTGLQGRCDVVLMRELATLANLTIMFSVDGLGDTHDRIRGAGSHARTLDAIRGYARSRGPICGASVTIRRDTWREVTSPEFVASLASLGCHLLAYDPWYAEQAGETISPEALAAAIARLQLVEDRLSIVFVNPFGRLRRDGFDSRGGMVAAAIDYRGNVYGSRRGVPLGNATEQRLGVILESATFRQGGCPLTVGACAADDPRARLFANTLDRINGSLPGRRAV